jgi:hypothetical protein
MAKITTDKAINIIQLDKELGNQGLSFDLNDSTAKIIITSDESKVTQKQLEDAIDKHIAQPIEKPTVADKLKRAGITLDELKEALGI